MEKRIEFKGVEFVLTERVNMLEITAAADGLEPSGCIVDANGERYNSYGCFGGRFDDPEVEAFAREVFGAEIKTWCAVQVLKSFDAEDRVAKDDPSDVDEALRSLDEDPEDLLMYSWFWELDPEEKKEYLADVDFGGEDPEDPDVQYLEWQSICRDNNRSVLAKIIEKYENSIEL